MSAPNAGVAKAIEALTAGAANASASNIAAKQAANKLAAAQAEAIAVSNNAAAAKTNLAQKVQAVTGDKANSGPSYMTSACSGAFVMGIVAAVMVAWGAHDVGYKERGSTGYNAAVGALGVGLFLVLCAACTIKLVD